MSPNLKQRLRRCCPTWLKVQWRRHRGGLYFSGPFKSWPEAAAACSGYDAPEILAKVTHATRAVIAGRAAYERDGVLFHDSGFDALLLSALGDIDQRNDGPLRVLDFGGSLGSTYYQLRRHLAFPVRWHVVEQQHYVEVGREEFRSDELDFHSSIGDALMQGLPHVVLLGSVLPYLEHPWMVLGQLAAVSAKICVVSRTSFTDAAKDYLMVQHVPAKIYPANYPAWVFSAPAFERFWRIRGATVSWHQTEEGVIPAPAGAITFRTAVISRHSRS